MKKRILGINAVFSILIFFIILFLINIISEKFFTRMDLTENKKFTLSKASRNFASALSDIVNVKCYFTKDLPPQLLGIKTQIEDLLKEYQSYSSNKIHYEFIDPSEDKKIISKLRRIGIPAVQMNVRTKDKLELKQGYLGIDIMYRGKNEVLPVVNDVSNFEYEFTSALKRLTVKEIPTVAYLSGFGSPKFHEDYSGILTEINKNYKFRTITINNKTKTIPEDITTLIVSGVKNVPDTAEFAIDQFLMKGGNAIFMLDRTEIEFAKLQAKTINNGLSDMLANYGVKILPQLTMDLSAITAGFRTQQYRFFVTYKYWIKVLSQFMNKTNPVTNKLTGLILRWANPIEINNNYDTSQVTISTLFTTTNRGWSIKEPFNIDPRNKLYPMKNEMRKVPLAALINGKINSYYSNKNNPWNENDSDTSNISSKLNKSIGSTIIVLGSSNFVKDEEIARTHANAAFFMNSLEYLTSGTELIEIRSRNIVDKPLKEVSASKRFWLKFLNTGLIPLLIIFFGLIFFFIRNKIRKKYIALTTKYQSEIGQEFEE